MNIGICAAVGKVQRTVKGLDFIEETVTNLLCPKEGDAAFQDKLLAARESILPVEAVNCFIPTDLKTTGPSVDRDALDAYVTTACERAAQVGVATIVFGSGGSRKVPDDFDHDKALAQLVDHLKRWGPIAQSGGITVVVEPLFRQGCNIINTVPEGADVVRRVDHPNIRLLADTYHMLENGEDPAGIRTGKGLLAHVHCAEKASRRWVGASGEDHRPFFRALKDIGYEGRVCLECKWTDLNAELPQAIAELRKQIEEA